MSKLLYVFCTLVGFLLLSMTFAFSSKKDPPNSINLVKVRNSANLSLKDSLVESNCCIVQANSQNSDIEYKSQIKNKDLEYKVMYLFFPYLGSNQSNYIRCNYSSCYVSSTQSVEGENGKVNATVLALSVGAYNDKLRSNGFEPITKNNHDIKYYNGKTEFLLEIKRDR